MGVGGPGWRTCRRGGRMRVYESSVGMALFEGIGGREGRERVEVKGIGSIGLEIYTRGDLTYHSVSNLHFVSSEGR